MPLTIEQQQRVLQHLEERNASSECKMCGRGELKVLPDMVCTPLAENKRGYIKIYAQDVITLVQVVCPDCWHVEQFMAEGIFST